VVSEGLRPIDELRALRRVATLVAEGVPPQQLFAVVADEVACVLEVPMATVLRYELDSTVTTCGRSDKGPPLEIGTRFALDGPSVLGQILTTGKAARIDDYSMLNGELPDAVRVGGGRASVGTPIVVSGRLWGAMVVSNVRAEPLPDGTEERLADFTELLATAIANAESRVALERLADEQAALRRVATLVGEGAPPAEICTAVSDEVDGLFDCGAGVARFEHDGLATVFTGVSKRITVPIGTRFEFQDGMASVEVYRTHQSARVDRNDWSTGDGALATTARQVGLVSSVASPIVVDGRLWGTMNLWSTDALLPQDTGERLEKFTELVGTAIANAQSRESLRILADEQAALRRIAILVARSVPTEELFTAVSDEVGHLFGSDTAAIVRLEHDPPAVVIVGLATKVVGVPMGTRSPLEPGMANTEVYRTGRSARLDDQNWSSVDGPLRETGRRMRLVSTVASPITVRDRLWGSISLSATEPLPPGTEARIERFGELLGIAIASADAQDAVRLLADEQAALRRVATLVAKGVPAAEIFQAVSEEIVHLFGEHIATVGKYDRDAPAITLVGVTNYLEGFAEMGARVEVSNETPSGRVYETGRPARVDRTDWSTATSPLGQVADRTGIVSAVSSPIIVEDRLWGTVSALSVTEPLPPDTERRLERFSELVATAISNAEGQEALTRLADEQAALRRVATLVAHGVHAAEVFHAVSEEVARLFGEDLASVARFAPTGGAITIVGLANHIEGVVVGTRLEISDDTPSARVWATGRPARVDRADWSIDASPIEQVAHRLAIVSSVGCPIIVEGRLWGVMTALSSTKVLPPDTEVRLQRFSELVATAIANAESRSELDASRRRIVAASDEARRRIERDLHDGTQQRLVALSLSVRATEADVPSDWHDIRSELSQIATGLTDAVVDLQDITRGIHPASLEQVGIGAALRTLARRSPVPVKLEIACESRLPEPIEVAVYYVASEALANAAKHAQATRIDVSLLRRDEGVVVSIRDDGIGEADPSGGSGLVGLTDRVEALGGSLEIRSTPGHGTLIAATLPLDAEPGASSSVAGGASVPKIPPEKRSET
jgi:signal transduction histidine kinase